MARNPIITARHAHAPTSIGVYVAGLIREDPDSLWLREQILLDPGFTYVGPYYTQLDPEREDTQAPPVPEALVGDESWALWDDPYLLKETILGRQRRLAQADVVFAWFNSPWYGMTIAEVLSAHAAEIPVFAGLFLDLDPQSDRQDGWRFSRAVRDLAPVLAPVAWVCAVPSVADAYHAFQRWCRDAVVPKQDAKPASDHEEQGAL